MSVSVAVVSSDLSDEAQHSVSHSWSGSRAPRQGSAAADVPVKPATFLTRSGSAHQTALNILNFSTLRQICSGLKITNAAGG